MTFLSDTSPDRIETTTETVPVSFWVLDPAPSRTVRPDVTDPAALLVLHERSIPPTDDSTDPVEAIPSTEGEAPDADRVEPQAGSDHPDEDGPGGGDEAIPEEATVPTPEPIPDFVRSTYERFLEHQEELGRRRRVGNGFSPTMRGRLATFRQRVAGRIDAMKRDLTPGAAPPPQ